MGIDINTARYLLSEHRRGVNFGRTLTLGHQQAYIESARYHKLVSGAGGRVTDPHFADDLFRAMGAETLDIMDASAYEHANVIHDLNSPVDKSLKERYDCVFDGGTLEHVFNYPVALRSCMEMVRVGGQLVLVTPMNNYVGHGFFQFSPELFYSALSAENGYAVERMCFHLRNQWYAVQNPSAIRRRVELIGREPLLLWISAKRVARCDVFDKWPQQSDYALAWTGIEGRPSGVDPESRWKKQLVAVVPGLRRIQFIWRQYKYRKLLSDANRAWFSPVSLQ